MARVYHSSIRLKLNEIMFSIKSGRRLAGIFHENRLTLSNRAEIRFNANGRQTFINLVISGVIVK